MATNLTVSGGGRFEEMGSISRVRRVGGLVFVAGTTAVEPSGRLHQPGDTYAQTRFVLDRLSSLLAEVGAELRHVVRTRAYLADIGTAGDYVRAHGGRPTPGSCRWPRLSRQDSPSPA